MARFFTSDLHLGHANIIRYCARPHRDVATMNLELLAHWEARVGAHDVVYVLGDVAMKVDEATTALFAALPGRKILIRGNHDRGRRERYAAMGFSEIVDHLDLRLANGVTAELSHYPFADPSPESAQRFRERRPISRGQWLLCGHVHEKWRQLGHQINVGVDAWGGVTVSEDEVVELIENGPANLAPRPWTPAHAASAGDGLVVASEVDA